LFLNGVDNLSPLLLLLLRVIDTATELISAIQAEQRRAYASIIIIIITVFLLRPLQ